MESANIRRGVTTDVPAITELWKEFMDFHASREKYFETSECLSGLPSFASRFRTNCG